jgi:23S rRNA (pseudouridine1915-N3)-methyltransferase
MKLHLITVGEPKLGYAKLGWEEYVQRLQRYHQVQVTHIADKHNDSSHLLKAAGDAVLVALVIDGPQYSSPQLATFIEQRALEAKPICFMIGGPDGLPPDIIKKAAYCWGFGKLTLPHDLAMVTLAETLYRASTITAGHPYHH